MLYISVISGLSKTELESFEYHQDSATYRAEYDQDKTSVSVAVVALLSEVIGCDPSKLDPVYESVDPDALDELARPRESTVGDISVTFTAARHSITVHSYGMVVIAPRDRDRTDDQNQQVTPT